MDLVEFLEHNWFAISSLIAIVGFTWKMSSKIANSDSERKAEKKELEDKLDDQKEHTDQAIKELRAEVQHNHDELKAKIDSQEEKRVSGIERNQIILQGVEATLFTLHSQGANGPVTKALNDIKEYQTKKSAE